MPFLLLERDDGEHTLVQIGSQTVTIGRDPGSALTLPSSAVSRLHATVTQREGRCVLRDMRSHNGSRVNGLPVKTTALSDGDRIEIAHFSIQYLEKDPSPPASPSPARAQAPTEPLPELTSKGAPRAAAPPDADDPKGRSRLPLLLAAAFLLILSVVALALGLMVWNRRAPRPIAAPAPTAASPGPTPTSTIATLAPAPVPVWTDPSDLVTLRPPAGFREIERTDQGVRYLGPQGATYAAAVTATVVPSRKLSLADELDLLERGLTAQHGSGYQRIGGGPIALAGRQGLFLQYRKPADGGTVVLQEWVVMLAEREQHLTFKLTAEVGQWGAVKQTFSGFLVGIGLPPLAPPSETSQGG